MVRVTSNVRRYDVTGPTSSVLDVRKYVNNVEIHIKERLFITAIGIR